MTHIKGLLDNREKVFDELTSSILEKLETATSAAGELLGENLQERLEWKTVVLVDDILMIAGQLEFSIGEKIMIDSGEEVEVTEELQPLLNRTIRVGVPLKMAENSTREEIIDYLKRLEAENKQQAIINESFNTSNETVADMAGEFRSAGLTQEQINNMLLFAEQSKGKVN